MSAWPRSDHAIWVPSGAAGAGPLRLKLLWVDVVEPAFSCHTIAFLAALRKLLVAKQVDMVFMGLVLSGQKVEYTTDKDVFFAFVLISLSFLAPLSPSTASFSSSPWRLSS